MALSIQVLTSMGHPEGDRRVDEMMEATEEAEEEAERLETERRASEGELGNSARASLASEVTKAGQQGCRATRRGQTTATAD